MEAKKRYNPMADLEFVSENYITMRTSKDLIDLEKAYLDAKEHGHLTFRFQEKLIVTDFGKYLIEHCKSKPLFRNVKLIKF